MAENPDNNAEAHRRSDQPEQEEQLPDFERSLEQIQQIIDGIESGEVSLEQSLDQYARGMKLIQHCRRILNQAEQRIQQLTVDEQGNVVEKEGGETAGGGGGQTQ